jgi:hypothetical protein
MCIGPVRANSTLGDRLLQDGVITAPMLQEILRVIGSPQPGETRIALTLMELGYVGHEDLRAWATCKAVEVLQVVLMWPSGEIHFHEEQTPSADRLLVALSISSLLASISIAPAPAPSTPSVVPDHTPLTPIQAIKEQEALKSAATLLAPDISKIPTLMSASQFFDSSSPEVASPSVETTGIRSSVESAPAASAFSREAPAAPATPPSDAPFVTAESPFSLDESGGISGMSLFSPDALEAALPATEALSSDTLSSVFDSADAFASTTSRPLAAPVPVTTPIIPKRIDISFMHPDMVLMPADLSAAREQNLSVALTPDQWRLLTRADGRTSLRAACQELGMLPEQICQVAGELIAENLIHVVAPVAGQMAAGPMRMPVAQERAMPGLSNGYVTPGYAAAPAAPWSAPAMVPETPRFAASASTHFETQSQWGNGGNGAIFVPGRGWVASPQPLQPLQSSGPLAVNSGMNSGMYAQVGGAY